MLNKTGKKRRKIAVCDVPRRQKLWMVPEQEHSPLAVNVLLCAHSQHPHDGDGDGDLPQIPPKSGLEL